MRDQLGVLWDSIQTRCHPIDRRFAVATVFVMRRCDPARCCTPVQVTPISIRHRGFLARSATSRFRAADALCSAILICHVSSFGKLGQWARSAEPTAESAVQSVSHLVNKAVRESLREDAADLQAFDERAGEPNLCFEDVLKDLKRFGDAHNEAQRALESTMSFPEKDAARALKRRMRAARIQALGKRVTARK